MMTAPGFCSMESNSLGGWGGGGLERDFKQIFNVAASRDVCSTICRWSVFFSVGEN